MTPRLQEVLECLLREGSEKQIAAELSLNPETVHEYVRHICQHCGVCSRPELMACWLRFHRGGAQT